MTGSRALLLTALAGAMALAAISAPLASAASSTVGATGFLPLPVVAAESAEPVEPTGGRRLLQNTCAACAGQPKIQVCSTSGKTFDNTCLLACGNAKLAYFGACKSKPCLCPPVWAPVCASGKTFVNSCVAKCSGAGSIKDGFCGIKCSCGSTKNPVCGLDGKNYDNLCSAYCQGNTVPYYSGTCDKRISDCACPTVNDPVCVKAELVTVVPGVGTVRTPYNATYSSPCLAKCQGKAKTWTKGACGDYTVYEASAFTCGCSFEVKPVCAELPILKTTMTLYSRCAATCVGYKVLYEGVCKNECLCPGIGSDVCANGRPFKSACQARCAGAKTWTDGQCAKCKSCPLPKSLDDYVCSKTGIPFPSACAAECAGEVVAYKGMCKFAGRK